MGLFNSIKKNITHGGLDLDLQMPDSVSTSDATLPITAIFTNNGSEPLTIEKTTADLVQETNNVAFGTATENNTQLNSQAQSQVMARVQNNEVFTVAPGQSQSLQLNIVMNQAALYNGSTQQATPNNPMVDQFMQVAGKLGELEQKLNSGSYNYRVSVYSNIQGIAMDISKNKNIRVSGSGSVGTSMGVGL